MLGFGRSPGVAWRRRRDRQEPQSRPRKCGRLCRRALARAATLLASAVRGVQPQTADVERRSCIVGGVFDLVANSAALPMRLFERDRAAKGEQGLRERQRAWRSMRPERLGTTSLQARRAAPAMRTSPQHRVRPEESGRARARRRRRARDRHTLISVEALVTVGAGDSGRGDRRSRSIALPRIGDAKVEQGFRIVGRFPVPTLPWSLAGNRQREPPGTAGASVSERDGRRSRRGRASRGPSAARSARDGRRCRSIAPGSKESGPRRRGDDAARERFPVRLRNEPPGCRAAGPCPQGSR